MVARREDRHEWEEAIPYFWVNAAQKIVYWPSQKIAKSAFIDGLAPEGDWDQFELIKV